MQSTGTKSKSVWRTERRARWFFAAHLQGALGTGAGYVALLLLAYEQIGSAWGAALLLILLVVILNLIARIVARVFAPKGLR